MNKEILIGEYYIDPDFKDLVRVISMNETKIHIEIIEDPHDLWGDATECQNTEPLFFLNYKHLPGYSTPLYRVLHNLDSSDVKTRLSQKEDKTD
jgi:hypothetical protein